VKILRSGLCVRAQEVLEEVSSVEVLEEVSSVVLEEVSSVVRLLLRVWRSTSVARVLVRVCSCMYACACAVECAMTSDVT